MKSPTDTSRLPAPWGPIALPDSSLHPQRIGPRELWFARRQGEIHVASRMAPVPEASIPPEPPDEVEWSRWAGPDQGREIFLRPTLPDRPVVLQPEIPFSLLPRAEVRIYVRIPLGVRVEVGGGDGTLLMETSSVELSDTWWGSFEDGELCYWLHTHARRKVVKSLLAPHLVLCPLLLLNRSDTDLRVEKLAFRVAHLSLFLHEGGLWADESVVRYQGETEGSQIEITGTPPPDARGAHKVADPRLPMPRGFSARTFAKFKSFQGLGGGL